MKRRSFLFSGPDTLSLPAEVGLLILRLFAGLALAFAHGLGKLPPSDGFVQGVADMGFPAPLLFSWLAGLSEFVGGILLALGLLTRPAAFFTASTMAVAAFIRHADDPFGGAEKAFLFGAVFLMFLLMGAGRLSIDGLIRRR